MGQVKTYLLLYFARIFGDDFPRASYEEGKSKLPFGPSGGKNQQERLTNDVLKEG